MREKPAAAAPHTHVKLNSYVNVFEFDCVAKSYAIWETLADRLNRLAPFNSGSSGRDLDRRFEIPGISRKLVDLSILSWNFPKAGVFNGICGRS